MCGCVCDDIHVTAAGGRIAGAERACELAKPWFAGQNSARPPAAEIDGDPTDPAAALDHAAAILGRARNPLIYGLSRSTTVGQRAAAALADRLGATIDTTASTGHAPSIMALQQVGESTCTLGEVGQLADLVVFWGSDPLTTHPRHIERYCPPRPGRTIVVVDESATATAKAADLFVPVAPGRHWELLWDLRLRIKAGTDVPVGSVASDELVRRMTASRFGIIFFGAAITHGPNAHRTVEALLQLVTDLNRGTRFYARRMRRYGDVAGADSVLAWQFGYPFGVNLAAGYPRYNPGEFTGPDMLARHEVDACLVVGGDTVRDFPAPALDHLRKIPVILLDPPEAEAPVRPAVKFTTAVYGIHHPGTAYRLDEVAIPLRPLLRTDYPDDGEILGALLRRLTA